MALIDLSGQRFGRLLVLDRAENGKNRKVRWNCLCDCGARIIARGGNLRTGHSKSCGCLQKEIAAYAKQKHGMTDTRQYQTWKSMKARCYNPSNKNYKDYGGRGITVCEQWRNDFAAFGEDMQAEYADDLEIDRIDPNGNYSPENCRWISRAAQNKNKRNSRPVDTPWGRICLAEAAVKSGLSPRTLSHRHSNGKPDEDLFKPPRKQGGSV